MKMQKDNLISSNNIDYVEKIYDKLEKALATDKKYIYARNIKSQHFACEYLIN